MGYYFIDTLTLQEIADAIRYVKGVDEFISVSELDDVLVGQVATRNDPKAKKSEYLIEKQTLVDIADAARAATGTTGKILVTDLAARILNIFSPSIVGKAILGKVVLGVYTSTPKLSTPIINLVTVDDSLPQLNKPNIYIWEESEVIVQQLAKPKIWLENIPDEEPDEPIVIKLGKPVIYLESIEI